MFNLHLEIRVDHIFGFEPHYFVTLVNSEWFAIILELLEIFADSWPLLLNEIVHARHYIQCKLLIQSKISLVN